MVGEARHGTACYGRRGEAGLGEAGWERLGVVGRDMARRGLVFINE